MFLKLNIDKQLYFSEELEQSTKSLLKNDELLNEEITERNGKAKTTSHVDDGKFILSMPGFNKLYSQISQVLMKTKILFNRENCSRILYTRIWANEMFKNSSGKVHVHQGDNDGVAIFYYKAPKHSSHFVVVDEEKFLQDSRDHVNINEYEMCDLSYIKVNEGDLIVHSLSLPHGVSEHLSDETRICFIFNFKFIE